MNILLLNHFFHPDQDAVAQLATDLAEDLVAAGHQVTVLAARGGYRRRQRLAACERWRGVQIVRAGGTSFGKASLAGRVTDYATFLLAACITALTLPRHDVVLATTAPPLIAAIGALLRATKASRFVVWMQDVYPELAVAFGLLGPRSPATWLMQRLSRATLRRADGVVVLGEPMAERIRAKGVPLERVHIVPNWADGAAIRPVPRETNMFRHANGLHGKRVVLYSGNMGRGHDLTKLLAAARRLRGQADLVFAFVGEGAKRGQVVEVAREVPSVRLFPFQPRERLSESLSAGDVHVVTMDPLTLGLLEPSKLYGAMAAGRPVLVIGPDSSEVARTVLREGIGEVVANDDVNQVVTALRRLLESADALGNRARLVFDRTYDRRHRTMTFGALLSRVVGR